MSGCVLFEGQQIVSPEREPLNVASAGDVFLVVTNDGLVNAYSAAETCVLLYQFQLVCSTVKCVKYLSARDCIVSIELEREDSDIYVSRVYSGWRVDVNQPFSFRVPADTASLSSSAQSEASSTSTSLSRLSYYTLDAGGKVLACDVCPVSGVVAISTLKRVTVWSCDQNDATCILELETVWPAFRVAVCSGFIAYSSTREVRVVHVSLPRMHSSSEDQEVLLAPASFDEPIVDPCCAELEFDSEGTPSPADAGSIMLLPSITTLYSKARISAFEWLGIRPDTTRAIHIPNESSDTTDLSVTLRMHRRFGPRDEIRALVFSPEVFSPESDASGAVKLLVCTAREGVLYNVTKPQMRARYAFRDECVCATVGGGLVYIATPVALEAWALREVGNENDFPDIDSLDPRPLGRQPVMYLQSIAVTDNRVALLSKFRESEIPGFGQERMTEQSIWNIYVLAPTGASQLFAELTHAAAEAGDADIERKARLLTEARAVLCGRIDSLSQMQEQPSMREESVDAWGRVVPGDVARMLSARVELETCRALLRKAESLLGETLLLAGENNAAALLFARSDMSVTKALTALRSAEAPASAEIAYLDRALCDPLIVSEKDIDLDRETADSVLRLYKKHSPDKLSRLVLESALCNYSPEIAMNMLDDLMNSVLPSTPNTPPAALSSKTELIFARILLAVELGKLENVESLIGSMDPETLVKLCVSQPHLLGVSDGTTAIKSLKHVLSLSVDSLKDSENFDEIVGLALPLLRFAPWCLLEIVSRISTMAPTHEADSFSGMCAVRALCGDLGATNDIPLSLLLLECYLEDRLVNGITDSELPQHDSALILCALYVHDLRNGITSTVRSKKTGPFSYREKWIKLRAARCSNRYRWMDCLPPFSSENLEEEKKEEEIDTFENPIENQGLSASNDEKDSKLIVQVSDPTLQDAIDFLPRAFVACENEINFLFMVSDNGDSSFDFTLSVSPEGAKILSGHVGVPECTIQLERSVLIGIVEGDIAATIALMTGHVIVDDLMKLMQFSNVFSFDRGKFKLFRKKREEKASREASEKRMSLLREKRRKQSHLLESMAMSMSPVVQDRVLAAIEEGSILESHLKLQGFLCSEHAKPILVHGGLSKILNWEGVSDEVEEDGDWLLVMKLLFDVVEHRLPRSFNRLLAFHPIAAVRFASTHCEKVGDWEPLLSRLFDACAVSETDSEDLLLHRDVYRFALHALASVAPAEAFLTVLPPRGKAKFFAPFLKQIVRRSSSKSVSRALKRAAAALMNDET